MEKEIIDKENDLLKEREILTLSKKDPAHFRFLYDKYFKIIFLYVFKRLGDKEVTNDIVSQVFVKALTNLNKYEDRGLPFSAWLYRIASNEMMQLFRDSKKVRLVPIDDQMIESICEDAKGPDLDEVKSNLDKIIQTMDLAEVQLLELRYFENKSYKEIAFITHSTETNVKTRCWRIIEKIRNKIKKNHEQE